MGFMNVLLKNMVKGVATDPFPFGETYTPERLRARVEVDASLCTGCGTCKHVCASGAINIVRREDGSGFDILVWRNTCCLCGQCGFYCPTKAITLSNNWHNAHRNTEKFTWITIASVDYDVCEGCGARMRFLPRSALDKIYAGHKDIDIDHIAHLCPRCRMMEAAVEDERACYIDHLKNMLDEGKACDINFLHQLEEAGRACRLDHLKQFVQSGENAKREAQSAKVPAPQASETKTAQGDSKPLD